MKRLVLIGILFASSTTSADSGTVLRLATVVPDGTPWSHPLGAAAAGIAAGTNGSVRIKWYFGGIVGDELETAERMKKGQIDGVASGGPLCDRIAPTMRVLGMPGLFQSRDEAAYVMHILRPSLVDEAQRNGFTLLLTSGLGPPVLFSRRPIRNMADLRATRLWTWELGEVELSAERAMGLRVVAGDVFTAGRAYDANKLDGFIAVPSAALTFQWSTQARYLTDLRIRYLTACVVITNRAFDRLSLEQQSVVREEFAKGDLRFEEVNRRIDDALLGDLFQKQGLVAVPVTASFRAEFFEAARAVRRQVAEKFISPDLLARVQQLLADYRAEHGIETR